MSIYHVRVSIKIILASLECIIMKLWQNILSNYLIFNLIKYTFSLYSYKQLIYLFSRYLYYSPTNFLDKFPIYTPPVIPRFPLYKLSYKMSN